MMPEDVIREVGLLVDQAVAKHGYEHELKVDAPQILEALRGDEELLWAAMQIHGSVFAMYGYEIENLTLENRTALLMIAWVIKGYTEERYGSKID
jgi:hypothetical protein